MVKKTIVADQQGKDAKKKFKSKEQTAAKFEKYRDKIEKKVKKSGREPIVLAEVSTQQNRFAVGNDELARSNGNGSEQSLPLSCTGDTNLEPEQMLEMYRLIVMTRLLEEKVVNLYRQSKVIGGVFRSLGQEATAVGTAFALQPGDFIAPLIRDMGAVLARGVAPRHVFAQYMARAAAPSGATDLQIHFVDFERGFVGQISHLGDMIPVMAGILLGKRMQGQNIVGVAYIGDGATSTGAFHEGVNFAAVQKLPLITIIESNGYAYSTPTRLQTACKDFVDKAIGYGIPGFVVDGNDVIACYETMKQAVEYARAGNGSVLIEAKTYRRKGHAEHDDQRYVPAGELEWWAENNDPLLRCEKFLIDNNFFTRKHLDNVTDEVRQFLEAEAAIADASPPPDPERAAYNVFDNNVVPPTFKRKILL